MSLPENQTPFTNSHMEMSNLSKLTTFQTLIPAFDNSSAVTAKYFFSTIELLANPTDFSDEERLIIARSRLRGEALTHLINSASLSKETDYSIFKNKFIDYFEAKESRATSQIQFSTLKMYPSETIKQYANRVDIATEKFFGQIDINSAPVLQLFEQTKLSKFIEGVKDEYKAHILLKDPKTISEAVQFVEILESNSKILNPQSLNTFAPNEGVFNQHLKNTHELIASIAKDVEGLKLQKFSQNLPTKCDICHKTNHTTKNCFYNSLTNNRQNPPRSYEEPRWAQNFQTRPYRWNGDERRDSRDRAFSPSRNSNRGQRGRGERCSGRGERVEFDRLGNSQYEQHPMRNAGNFRRGRF